MKKILALGAILVLLTGGAALAAVVGSSHDLTSATGGGTYTTAGTDQVCVFCHTPHGASAAAAVVLWNRGNTDPTLYTMYDNVFSASIDMNIAADPRGVSLACLSCHDGQIAFDVLINGPGAGNYNALGASQGYVFAPANSLLGVGPPTELGLGLTDDHPISIDYDDTLDLGNFVALAVVRADPDVRLYGPAATADQVECGSCHDPHSTAFPTFLRSTNAASALCLKCHIK